MYFLYVGITLLEILTQDIPYPELSVMNVAVGICSGDVVPVVGTYIYIYIYMT